MTAANESLVEAAALGWFEELGYTVAHGPDLAPGEPGAERASFGDVVLVGRLRDAIGRLNPGLPPEAQEEALRKVLRVATPSLAQTNRAFHALLRDGVPVEYRRPDGSIAGYHARLADFGAPTRNDWLAVNQFTIIDRRAGVVWHTQGSGKSFSMLFYAAWVIGHPAMQNPTVVVLTDRNDLDDQLFGQFQRCHEILRQTPVQAADREHLRTLLQVASGGVVFTTIQKFLPEGKGERMGLLSDRRNVVVIADEAHRSQYDLIDGLARIRNKIRRRELATRFKDPKDPFRIVIVRDMWLTGFDAPCLHTMYADKPMQGHGLMQAIARVNRVFRDKPGGLVVDYLGLADQLKHALAVYTENGGQGSPSIDTAQAIALMQEKHEVACDMMHGFDWSKWTTGTPAERLGLIPAAQEHVLDQENGKARFVQVVTDLSRIFALCAASDEAIELRDDIAFFQAIKAQLAKSTGSQKSPEELDHAIRQLVSTAIMADEGIIDVFTAAGLKKPDISILSDQFLAEVRGLQHKNVAAELLAKLLRDEVKTRAKRNLVQSQQFSDMLQRTLNAYHNLAIATHEVIEELIRLAKEMDAATKRGVDLGLNEDEVAFYDALAANESAVKAMGSAELRVIAAELVTMVRKSVTIDWTVRESARARIKVMVKRILRKHGYPPDLQDEATKIVLAQAELLCADLV